MAMLHNRLNGRMSGLVFRTRKGAPLSRDVLNQKHLYPFFEKLGFEKGRYAGFRRHRVSALVM